MVKSADCFPNFGVYQGLRYDSRVQLEAVVAIAHAEAIGYFSRQGVDYSMLEPRKVFGITLTSQKDSAQVVDKLVLGNFDLQAFQQAVEELPLPEHPVLLGNPCISHAGLPKAFGFRLKQDHIGALEGGASAVRLAAEEFGGSALPVRSLFRHINLFYCGTAYSRIPLTPQQRQDLRDIASEARAEVGVSAVYMGKTVVGSEIGMPLASQLFTVK